MKKITILTFLLVSAIQMSCNPGTKRDTKTEAPEKSTIVYLIRHAEKDRSDAENRDPELLPEGHARAEYWAQVLKEVPLAAVYSTNYKRTQQTATPVAVSKGLEIIPYTDQSEAISNWKENHKGDHILVVGHSNTIPDIVNALIGEEKYSHIEDRNNANLYIVTLQEGIAESILLQPAFTSKKDTVQP